MTIGTPANCLENVLKNILFFRVINGGGRLKFIKHDHQSVRYLVFEAVLHADSLPLYESHQR